MQSKIQIIQPASEDEVVEDLDEALAGERGAVQLRRVVGAEQGVSGFFDDAIHRFDRKIF